MQEATENKYTVCKVKHVYSVLEGDETKCLKFEDAEHDEDRGCKIYIDTAGKIQENKEYRLRYCRPGHLKREVFFKAEKMGEEEITGQLQYSKSLKKDHLDLRGAA